MTSASQPKALIYSPLAADPDFADIVAMFVEEMPGRIRGLLELLHQRDWESLRRTAHQIKGAGGSYGFSTITATAAQLEQTLKAKLSEEAIAQAVGELVEMCARATAEPPRG